MQLSYSNFPCLGLFMLICTLCLPYQALDIYTGDQIVLFHLNAT